ncbi:MAG TPA: hypothetical protein VKA95_09105 [Nitrososphaeraceae archaeon]|nr:hypothetical protein [Nitrososphaeraceae archaeon]
MGFRQPKQVVLNCPSKGGASTTIDPNSPNAINTNIPPITPRPTVSSKRI